MSAFNPPLQPGEFSTDQNLAADVGNVYRFGDCAYRLCKFTANLSAAACKVVKTALSSGRPTWVVTVADEALISGSKRKVGVVSTPDGTLATSITGSATTATAAQITASTTVPAYGLVCIGGPHQVVWDGVTALLSGQNLKVVSGNSGFVSQVVSGDTIIGTGGASVTLDLEYLGTGIASGAEAAVWGMCKFGA
jgi:hypothetical protein